MARKIRDIFFLSFLWIWIISTVFFILLFLYQVLRQMFFRRNSRAAIPTQQSSRLAFDLDMLLLRRRMVSETQLIVLPSYNYTKDIIGLVSKTHDQTCAVCLSDFLDGEPVRVLPDCLHPFHVPCIDMWLYSHSNCPVCRTNVTTPAENTCLEVAAT
ncbi:unnamed protein product [Camellia sinensis]